MRWSPLLATTTIRDDQLTSRDVSCFLLSLFLLLLSFLLQQEHATN
jgi:hypothetical protein